MKILLLTPWYPDKHNPNHGIFVRDQALAIRQNHEVWVVSSKIDYTAFGFSSLTRRDSAFQGLKESRITIKRSLPLYNQFNFFLLTVLETRRIAKVFKPDMIHANIGYPGAFWGWVISRLLKIPFVITEHTRITNNFRSFIHKQLTLFGLKRASKIIAVSHRHADEIFPFVGKDPEVIPNVINFEKFPEVTPLPDMAEIQIGFLGGLNTPVKGLDVLLQAITRISGNFKLHIGGKGRLLEDYKRLAKELKIFDKCIFYGGIPHEEVNSFMAKLHFFVSASRFETFGIAMVEAMACGLPVIATDSGGSAEFISPENGMIVPVQDAVKLGKAISVMMNTYTAYNPHLIRKNVLTKFSDVTFLKQIDALYTGVIKTYKA